VCRLLQKTRLRHLNSIVIRDSLRNELAKQTRIEEEMREKRKQQKMEIEKLNNMINHAEVRGINPNYKVYFQESSDYYLIKIQNF